MDKAPATYVHGIPRRRASHRIVPADKPSIGVRKHERRGARTGDGEHRYLGALLRHGPALAAAYSYSIYTAGRLIATSGMVLFFNIYTVDQVRYPGGTRVILVVITCLLATLVLWCPPTRRPTLRPRSPPTRSSPRGGGAARRRTPTTRVHRRGLRGVK